MRAAKIKKRCNSFVTLDGYESCLLFGKIEICCDWHVTKVLRECYVKKGNRGQKDFHSASIERHFHFGAGWIASIEQNPALAFDVQVL